MKTKLTQKNIAKMMGISPEFLSDALNGKRDISKTTSLKLVKILADFGLNVAPEDCLFNPQAVRQQIRDAKKANKLK